MNYSILFYKTNDIVKIFPKKIFFEFLIKKIN
jgi:hypothetical protein